jgi:hypothetical protein
MIKAMRSSPLNTDEPGDNRFGLTDDADRDSISPWACGAAASIRAIATAAARRRRSHVFQFGFPAIH